MTSAENRYKNYQGKDPMSPEKITSHEPIAIKRDTNDQEIAGGQTTNTEQAKEKYRKRYVQSSRRSNHINFLFNSFRIYSCQ